LHIVVANEEAYQKGAAPYYTNSSQLPVDFTDDVFEALDIQDELQCKYTGGTVFHTFVGEKMTIDSVKKMVKKISNNYHLPYFTLTPTFSVCPVHGYLNGEHEYCPKCDLEIAEGEKAFVAEDVLEDVSDAEVAAADVVEEKVPSLPSREVEAPKLIAPTITVEGDTITVVDSPNGHAPAGPGNSELNIGGDTNGENEM
jgi:hypothetical protein